MNTRQLFLQHVAQTSPEPMALHIARAQGSFLYDINGKPYIDLIGGISVSHIGHGHPEVVKAIQQQAEEYLHIMVYGELVQSPQVRYAHLLTQHLPAHLDNVYFTNSGAEAVEGAMKLAKRYTGKSKIIAAHKSYHGSTQGALSLLGDEYFRNAFRPLLPDISHLRYNSFEDIDMIDDRTAAVILEPVQAEAGVLEPNVEWLRAIQSRCKQVGALLIFDEIQTGFGRTGSLFAFQKWGIEPDVLLLGKALGGGMPLGAFISSTEIMSHISFQPVLGHISTFAGHPVSCAAGHAAFQVLLRERYHEEVPRLNTFILQHLQHPKILGIQHSGLMFAVRLQDFDQIKSLITYLSHRPDCGVFTDWFLFASDAFRIVPPLCITEEELAQACDIIIEALDHI